MRRSLLLLCGVIALLSVLAYFWPDPWIYQRDAILDGQWWRLISGHWVHFTELHLLANLAVVLPSVWILGKQDWVRPLLFITASMLAIGLGLLIFEPELTTFGGLSGIAIALLTRIACLWLQDPAMRLAGGLMLAVMTAKVFFADAMGTGIVPLSPGLETVQLSHVIGFLVGTGVGFARCIRRA